MEMKMRNLPRRRNIICSESCVILAFAVSGCSRQTANTNSPSANDNSSSTTESPVPQAEQAEVVPAVKFATSTEPLRGMAAPPVNLAGERKKKEIHLNPNVLVSLGAATPDAALQRHPRRRSHRRR
jgi:hypothetical protein